MLSLNASVLMLTFLVDLLIGSKTMYIWVLGLFVISRVIVLQKSSKMSSLRVVVN